MSETLLVRHAQCTGLGERLNGRAAGVRLDATGAAQAAALGAALRDAPLTAACTGPLERARETAAAIAGPHGLAPEVIAALDEVDWGEWTGRSFAELRALPEWHAWHRARATAPIPGGERLADVQGRAVAAILDLRARFPHGTLVVVSHAEIIRLLLARFLGMPLEHALRLEIEPASVSRIRWQRAEPVVAGVGLPAAALLASQSAGPLRA